MRTDGRADDGIRPLSFERGFSEHPGGSVLVSWGRTRVLCTAMLEEGVPPFLLDTGRGWLTAEYSMLPGSTPTRKRRDVSRGKLDGRSTEIQRLIGRSLRVAVDLSRLDGYTLWLDCDVLQADGGTRTAAINGAWVAARDACERALAAGSLPESPIVEQIAAVSVGVIDGEARLDLAAEEDQRAEVDMNVVMTAGGDFVEVQGSAEKGTFDDAMLARLLGLAKSGVRQVGDGQQSALAEGGA